MHFKAAPRGSRPGRLLGRACCTRISTHNVCLPDDTKALAVQPLPGTATSNSMSSPSSSGSSVSSLQPSTFIASALAACHLLSACLVPSLLTPQPAQAVLNSPNAQIPRTVDAALRRSIPAFNPEVKKLQKYMEDIAYLLRIPQRKPWGNMAANVDASLQLVTSRDVLLSGMDPSTVQQGSQLLDQCFSALKKLELAVKTQQPDAVSIRVADVLKLVADLELLQAPGLPFVIPKEYANMPRLTGRAVVELVLEKADGSAAFVDDEIGGVSTEASVQITLDGYSAPISAGNFLKNVMDGLYDGRRLQVNYNTVYADGKLDSPRSPIPLEILPAGEFGPVYRLPLDVQNGELPVLPLSISGAISMAHIPSTDSYLSGDAWFVYKFDKQQAGLAGLSFDEGTFGVFGYVTKGLDQIGRLQSDDLVVKARVVSGADRLYVPSLE